MSNLLSPEEKRAIQQGSLKALLEIKRLCELHGLKYYLTAGTLLGAVRHKGFIPWDDDIDVAMPRADYDKFAKIAKKGLDSDFFYQDERTDKNAPFAFAKVRLNGSEVKEELLLGAKMHNGCYADIFPLDRCPQSDRRAMRFFKLTNLAHCALISKINPSFVCEYTRGVARAAFAVARLMPRWALLLFRRAVRAYYTATSKKGKLCTVSGSYGYPRESYLEKWFYGSCVMSFEGESLPAPCGYDELLTNMYGDYMTPPPESERGGHFVK